MSGETGSEHAPIECWSSDSPEVTLPLHVEEVAVSRRRVPRAVVRVSTVTRTRTHVVDETLAHERVEVERIPIGQYVNAVPSIREEGNVTVLPVVEEVLVMERRLLLREEVHVRRVRGTDRHVETITLREQEAVVTRQPVFDEVPAPIRTTDQETKS